MKIRELIQRYIHEMNGHDGRKGMKPLGESHHYTLKRLMRDPIADIAADNLTNQDVKDFALRRSEKVCAATVGQDVTYLSGILAYAGSEWDDCANVTNAAVLVAKKTLTKKGIVGKSTPRKVRPTEQQIAQLMDYFAQSKVQIRMADVVAFGLASSRRISEVCRITHGDVDWANVDAEGHAAPMYTVRDLKHPTKKKGNDKRFPLFPELAEIIRRQPRTSVDPAERIFPFRSRSVTAAYIRAKKACKIENLRLHDNRREAITQWLRKFSVHEVRHYVSGHENSAILERNYDATDPTEGHAAIRKATEVRMAA